jgi:DNA-directed RNA polymerase subunit RPC12/RpoP
MNEELYFDCTTCSNTLRVDRALVGQYVDCPKCDSQVLVPDIRDGLNPRYRSQLPQIRRILGNTDPSSRIEKRKPALLVDDMQSLSRRMAEQGRQLEYLQHNVSLCVKQLNLIRDTSASTLPLAGPKRVPVQKGPSSAMLLKWSLGLSLWVVFTGLVMVIYLFKQ